MLVIDKGGITHLWYASIVWLALPCICTAMRVYSRAVLLGRYSWDDWLQLASLTTYSGACGLLIHACRPGHFETLVSLSDFIAWGNELIAISNLYLITTQLLKISLALFYLRFLHSAWERKTVILTTVLFCLTGLAFLVVFNTNCGAITSWVLNSILHRCRPWPLLRAFNYAYSALNMLSDWVFALIPIATVCRMQMSRRSKICTIALLGVAIASSIAGVARFFYIDGLDIEQHGTVDPRITITSVYEGGLAQCATCLACCRPLFRNVRDKFWPKAESEASGGAGVRGAVSAKRAKGLSNDEELLKHTQASTRYELEKPVTNASMFSVGFGREDV